MNNSNDYDEKYMKMKFNSDDDLYGNRLLDLFFMMATNITRKFFYICLFRMFT